MNIFYFTKISANDIRGLIRRFTDQKLSSSKQTIKQNTIKEIQTFRKMFLLIKIISSKTRFSKKYNSAFCV